MTKKKENDEQPNGFVFPETFVLPDGDDYAEVVIRKIPTCKMVGKTPSGLYTDVAEGNFPKPIKLGPRAVGWLLSEVQEWIATRKKERDDQAIENERLV